MNIKDLVQRYSPLHLLLSLILYSSVVVANIDLPETFSAETFTLQSSKKFYIQGEEDLIGIVHRKLHSQSYEFIDSERNLCSVASLDKERTELGTKFDIHDAEGAYLGSIVESPFSFLPEFHILSPSGKIEAISSSNFLHTEYTLINPETGNILATLFRPAFRDCNDWSAKIEIPFELDPYVFISFLTIRSDS